MDAILTAIAVYLIAGLIMMIGYVSATCWSKVRGQRWWRVPACIVFGAFLLPASYLLAEGERQARR
jgi:ABC-type Fe3+-siderophore transport system permease subunit